MAKEKTKGKAKELDQFYTNKELAKTIYEKILVFIKQNSIEFDMWLEPSAGDGAFFSLLPENKLGIDIDKKINGIIEADFLTYKLPEQTYFTIGNPPFGQNCNLALKFINKCADQSVAIAFILPKTFKKQSMNSRVNEFFHLEYEEDIPKDSFLLEGQTTDVPCVFQIWVKQQVKRMKEKVVTIHKDFEFLNSDKKAGAHYSFQRVGAGAGKVKDVKDTGADQSHLYIKENKPGVRKILESIDWSIVKGNTAGNPSISKSEIITEYNKKMGGC